MNVDILPKTNMNLPDECYSCIVPINLHIYVLILFLVYNHRQICQLHARNKVHKSQICFNSPTLLYSSAKDPSDDRGIFLQNACPSFDMSSVISIQSYSGVT
jgi:hypothetical protein